MNTFFANVTEHGGDTVGFLERHGKAPLDFSINVNPLGIPDAVKAAIAKAAEYAFSYPDTRCRELSAAIALHEGISAESIFCSCGAADIIYRIAAANKFRRALLVAPCFSEYEQALKLFGCKAEHYFVKSENDFDIGEDILSRLDDGIDVVFLCNPNNPTGRLIKKPLLKEILKRCREKNILLVIDECFLGFCEDYQALSLKNEADSVKGLIVLNAFTKLYGMAGVRLGWCVCSDKELLNRIKNAGQPWAVSSLAQAAGIAALKETEYIKKSQALIKDERKRIAMALKELSMQVVEGKADFLLFKSTIKGLGARLEQKGILIRDCASFLGLTEDYYRIGIKRREQNDMLIWAITKIAEEQQNTENNLFKAKGAAK